MVRLEDSTQVEGEDKHVSIRSFGDLRRYSVLLSQLRAGNNGTSPTPSVIGTICCQESSAGAMLAAQLAVAAATEMFQSALALDLSGPCSQMPNLLGTPSGPGIVEILTGKEDLGDCLICGGHNGDFHFIPWGSQDGQTPASMNVSRCAELIEACRAQFELIVVSLPPASESSPGSALAACVDGVLVVIESEKTPVVAAQRARKLLERSRARVLGAILSNSRDYLPALLRSKD